MRLLLAGLLLLISVQSWADTLAERLHPVVAQASSTRIWTLSSENDLFGSGTDQHYTNGLRLTLFDVGYRPPHFTNWLANRLPGFDADSIVSTYYSLGHNLYTPQDITQRQPALTDRPYAAFLYGAVGLTSVYKNHVDELELTIGWVGPSALGEPIQETVHDLTGARDPQGWDTQLKDEPGLMLSHQRRWPAWWRQRQSDLFWNLTPHVGLTAGNIYTYGQVGATLSLSPYTTRWQDRPLAVRPHIPGTGYFQNVPIWSWALFTGVDGRAVARNIFLDGNTWRESRRVDKKALVADVTAGFTLSRGRTRLSYTLVYRSEEFDGQDSGDVFGALGISWRF